MTPGNAPLVPPTATELSNDPVVIQAIEQAWIDSQAGDAINRHEEGGWIYMNTTTGTFLALLAPAGALFGIDLSQPIVVAGAVVVGKFHTHPNPTAAGWTPGP